MKKLFALIVCAVALSTAHANLKLASKVGTFGNWTVLRDVDKMTDKVSCTGIYKDDYGKQLAERGLYIQVRGGISSVTLRFDDEPPRPMRLAEKLEKDVRAVMLQGAEFDSVVAAKRLRGQVLTLVSGIQDFELDLAGISEALASIREGCPPVALTPEAPAAAPSPAAPKATSCSPELLDRMKAAKVTPAQVQRICASTDS